MILAWQINNLARAKRLPDLKRYLKPKKEPSKAQVEQDRDYLKNLAAQLDKKPNGT